MVAVVLSLPMSMLILILILMLMMVMKSVTYVIDPWNIVIDQSSVSDSSLSLSRGGGS